MALKLYKSIYENHSVEGNADDFLVELVRKAKNKGGFLFGLLTILDEGGDFSKLFTSSYNFSNINHFPKLKKIYQGFDFSYNSDSTFDQGVGSNNQDVDVYSGENIGLNFDFTIEDAKYLFFILGGLKPLLSPEALDKTTIEYISSPQEIMKDVTKFINHVEQVIQKRL